MVDFFVFEEDGYIGTLCFIDSDERVVFLSWEEDSLCVSVHIHFSELLVMNECFDFFSGELVELCRVVLLNSDSVSNAVSVVDGSVFDIDIDRVGADLLLVGPADGVGVEYGNGVFGVVDE